MTKREAMTKREVVLSDMQEVKEAVAEIVAMAQSENYNWIRLATVAEFVADVAYGTASAIARGELDE
jgi:hypothetical protein